MSLVFKSKDLVQTPSLQISLVCWIAMRMFVQFLHVPSHSNHKLRTLAKGLSPGFLRFGGTNTDFLIFDPTKDSTLEERELWELQGNQGKMEGVERHV